MIFVTLGSQKFQFNRLLIELDDLLENKEIKDEIFAQIGESDYIPKNYKSKKYLDRKDFLEKINNCDMLITHGGTGAIMSGVIAGKKVIAVPRLAEFHEHVDNHQEQIVKEFSEDGIILGCFNIENLKKLIKDKEFVPKKYNSGSDEIKKSIKDFITSL